jgi:DNA-binding NarL/FixJ family response regulator
MTVNLVLADDQALLRAGLQLLLEAQPDIRVVGQANDGLEAVHVVQQVRPDVVLMDIQMPRLDGIEATRRILAGEGARPAIVVLTTFDEDRYVFEALRAGASGFLLKTAPAAQLVEAVRVAAAGDAMLAPSVTRRLLERFAAPRLSPTAAAGEFTERELDVLRLVARGLSNLEIGERLYVTEATVKTHIGHMLGKLGLRDRVQLVIHAYETGLVQPGATE